MGWVKRLIPVVLCGGIFGLVVWQMEPPKVTTEASLFQLVAFFIPLFLLITSLVNLFFRFLLRSLFIALGVTILLILQGLSSLTLVSGGITVIATILLAYSLKKPVERYQVKIPKLSRLQKQR